MVGPVGALARCVACRHSIVVHEPNDGACNVDGCRCAAFLVALTPTEAMGLDHTPDWSIPPMFPEQLNNDAT